MLGYVFFLSACCVDSESGWFISFLFKGMLHLSKSDNMKNSTLSTCMLCFYLSMLKFSFVK